jgi:hypothetical protein
MNEPFELLITDITLKNYRSKFAKAIRKATSYLKVPVFVKTIEHSREPYFYDIQQELSDRWTNSYSQMLKNIYKVVISALGLPSVEVETMKKAIDNVLKWKGKIIYSPETGEPLSNNDFDDLMEAIEKYLNRNRGFWDQKFLETVTIEKLLKRMAKYQTSEAMKKLRLDNLRYKNKTFDWISDNIKNLNSVLGDPMSGWEMARYQIAQQNVANLVTRSNDQIKFEIKDTILKGIINKRSKGQVAQDLFNRMGGLNRDWKRIADTEIVNTSNLAGIMHEVKNSPEGEKIYFKRYELPGCCDKCAKVNGTIALWSDTPLDDDKIKDPYAKVALWEGKEQEKGKTVLVTGTLHPQCRGGWIRWGGKQIDAMTAELQGKADKWDSAVKQAKDEYKEKGIENPNDSTAGYVDRINELYGEGE